MANTGFDQGRHYWSITLDAFGHEKDIFIGVCTRDAGASAELGLEAPKRGFDFSRHMMESGTPSWGWICTDGKKVGSTLVGSHAYGDYSKIGEELGMLLHFD